MKKLDRGYLFISMAIILMVINVILDYFNGTLSLISFVGTAAILVILFFSWPKKK